MTTQRPILVFDVNETLLDLDHLGPVFQEIFGDRAVMRDWFAQLILYSQTLTLIGARENFAALAVSVLEMMGTIRGIAITDRDRAALARALGSLPAHPDAAEALDYLRDLGFRMVTLTNSPPSDGPSALDRAGLGGYFERSFSVAPTGRFKPAPQTYRLVADALAVTPRDLCLVACHVWDTMGLQAMGGKGALVTHGVNAPLPGRSVPQPDLVAADLSSLARKIAEAWPG
ncbi:MAG: haloacid dehalogenase type II [Paracoccus sp.]|nr:haloacid dehalogenase type II [Paracoccus sp. (in: a-proteobacteria)]